MANDSYREEEMAETHEAPLINNQQTMKLSHNTALFVALLAISGVSHGAVLFDDFSTDTSANYTASNGSGSGGTFNVSSGTLNILPASANTRTVVHTTSSLAVGESYSIDMLDSWTGSNAGTGGDGQFLLLTTGTGQPNGAANGSGFRLRIDSFSTIRLYTGSTSGVTTVNVSPTVAPSVVAPGTVWVDRVTATQFDFYYGAAGSRTFLTTGTLNATEAANQIRVGVQAYSDTGHAEEFNFDNLRIQSIASIPEPSSAALLGLVAFTGLLRRRR